MKKPLRAGLLLTLILVCLALLTLLYIVQINLKPTPPPLNRVAAWMPTSWDAARARASWEDHQAHIHELSPVWYQLDIRGDGSIALYEGARDTALVEQAHAQDILILPLINNAYNAGFDPTPASTVIHDPVRRAAHIAVLVNEALTYGYDGIDIDYESLNGLEDRDAFSLFIEELATALHAQGKLLSVTVHPKTDEPGLWSGPQAQDWSRIGAAADRFRVMTYSYHWRTGPPGPIAPLFWMEEVMVFATSIVSPNQVYLGLHFYGMDWGEGSATALTWESAHALLSTQNAHRQWMEEDTRGRAIAEPWFTYTTGSTQHEVWYTDAASIARRLRLVSEYGLGGVAVWRLGGEDPENWSIISKSFSATAPPFPTISP